MQTQETKRVGGSYGASAKGGPGFPWLRFATVLWTKPLQSLAHLAAIVLFMLLQIVLNFNDGICQTHLNPARDFSSYPKDLKEYYQAIFEFSHIGGNTVVRFIALPSFSSEYSLSLQKVDNSYILVARRLSENLWYAGYEDKKAVHAVEKEKLIKDDLALALKELINTATQNLKPQEDILGFDGETYFFTSFISSTDSVTGEVWSPSKTSTLGKLVTTLNDLIEYAEGNGKAESELFTQITALTKEL